MNTEPNVPEIPQSTRPSNAVLVVGAGYVGLTTAVCLASLGNFVVCVDNDKSKISSILSGVLPIYEPGLLDLLNTTVNEHKLSFSTDLIEHSKSAEYVFLCLPTPALEDGTSDLSYIFQVVDEISPYLSDDVIIVNKSTVPLNTASQIRKRQSNPSVGVVSNPEFLREGSAVNDFLQPSRIVIGSDSPIIAQRVANLYIGLQDRIYFTDPISAECIKYMSNGFLAMKISFINEAARFCDAVGADIIDVAGGLALDPRIGSAFLNPGPGWGGSCFPKDTSALAATARYMGSPMLLIEESIRANNSHQTDIAKLVVELVNRISEDHPKIAVLGLSFKANTDDIRVSPALKILHLIAQRTHNIQIHSYDPMAKQDETLDFVRSQSLELAIDGADIVVVFTEWDEIAEASPQLFAERMRGNTIVDTRYLYSKDQFQKFNLNVISVGKN
jgi:UDPglucose 6-dehydrogenase